MKSCILHTDAISGMFSLPDKCISMICTSPPYFGLRHYQTAPYTWPEVKYSILGFEVIIPEMCCELGQEPDPKEFIGHMVLVFREAWRVLRDDGTLWVNIADSYAGYWGKKYAHKPFGEDRTADSSTPPNKPSPNFIKSKRGRKEDGVTRWGGGNIAISRDSYLKPRDLIGIPSMLAMALRDDGWNWHQDIIWFKKNCMPESTNTRCTKSHEYVFMFSKPGKNRCWRSKDTDEWAWSKPDMTEKLPSGRPRWEGHSYYYDAESIKTEAKESSIARVNQDTANQVGSPVPGKSNGMMKAVFHGNVARPGVDTKGGNQAKHLPGVAREKQRGHGRRHAGFNGRWDQMSKGEQQSFKANKRDVWIVSPAQYSEDHFAVFPEELIWDMVLAGCPIGGTVLDPFFGRGTTGVVARKQNKNYIGIDLLEKNVRLAEKYIKKKLEGWQHTMFPDQFTK